MTHKHSYAARETYTHTSCAPADPATGAAVPRQRLLAEAEKLERDMSELLGDDGVLLYPVYPSSAVRTRGRGGGAGAHIG
jgi:hypothetical protein